MSDSSLVQIEMELSIEDATRDEISDTTYRLLDRLKEIGVDKAGLRDAGPAPNGTMGADAVTLGAIALAVAPTALPKILEYLQSWSLQGRGRTIKFKGKIADQQIDFEGSFAEMEKVVALLEMKNKKPKK